MERFKRVCRVCLQKATEEDFISFDTPFEMDEQKTSSTPFTYLDGFRLCTQLEVDQQTKYTPQGLCVACQLELNIVYEFLQKARKSDDILRRSLQLSKVRKEFHSDESTHESNFVSVKSFFCDVCQQTFMTKGLLDSHSAICIIEQSDEVEANSEREDEFLTECGSPQEFMEVEVLDHEDTDSNVNEFSIDDAGSALNDETSSKNFDISEALENYNKQLTVRQNKCKVCQTEIEKGDDMRQHLNEHHSHVVQCTRCPYKGKEFRMHEHMAKMHDVVGELQCNICSKLFTTHVQLSAHLKYHERKMARQKSDACDICGKRFSTKNYLLQHQVTHRTDRDVFQCTECRKTYISKAALETHMRLHQKEAGSTVVCEICGKHFPRSYELMIHKRFHKRERPFACDFCPKRFAIKGHLRTHMWRHEGVKLKCETCGKLFASTKALTEHSYTHTTMPYPCSYCAKSYPSKQKYKVHLKANHGRILTPEEWANVNSALTRAPLKRKKWTLVKVGDGTQEEYLEEYLDVD